MNRKLLERILGTAILLAAGALFIPIFLGDPVLRAPPRPEKLLPDKALPDLDLEIPNSPVAPLEEKREVSKGLLGMQPIPSPAADSPQPLPSETAAASSAQAGQGAWIVQISSFRERAPAEKLQNELRRASYTAFIRKTQQNGVSWYQVRVGPESGRAEAEVLRHRLQQAFALEGLILHQP